MKGISAIIATILLLLIVVAIVGFTFTYLQGSFMSTTNSTSAMLNQTITMTSQVIKIVNIASAGISPNVTIASIGSGSIVNTSLAIYLTNSTVSGMNASCTGWGWTDAAGNQLSGGTLSPNGYARCVLNVRCDAGTTLKITTPGGYVQGSC